LICRLLVCLNTELRGGKGIKLEPNPSSLIENEDFLLLIKNLLDAIDAMKESGKRVDSY
jgi:hypothetical protein